MSHPDRSAPGVDPRRSGLRRGGIRTDGSVFERIRRSMESTGLYVLDGPGTIREHVRDIGGICSLLEIAVCLIRLFRCRCLGATTWEFGATAAD